MLLACLPPAAPAVLPEGQYTAVARGSASGGASYVRAGTVRRAPEGLASHALKPGARSRT